MQQVMTSIPAQKSPVHPPPAAATVAEIMRASLTTVNQYDHVAGDDVKTVNCLDRTR